MSQRTERLLQEILKELKGSSGASTDADGGGGESEKSRIQERRKDTINQLKAQIRLNEELVQQETDREKQLKLEIALFEEKVRLQRELATQAALGAPEDSTAIAEATRLAKEYTNDIKKLNAELNNLPDDPFKDFADLSTRSKIQKVAASAANAVTSFMGAGDAVGTAGDSMTGLVKAAGTLNPTTIGLEVMKTFPKVTAAAVQESDKLRAQFVAITGDAGEARDAFIDLTLANTNLAIGFEQMMNAQLALREGFVDFVFLSDGVKNSLTLQTATMEKLGVDAATTAEGMNTLTQSFGMTHTEAIQVQRDMVGLGSALGIPPKVIAQEFNKALPALAEFGQQATEVFERLVIASRETGLSIEQLTGTFGDAMNTYQGSAQAAGRLNAVLGAGLISGTELLMADAEERLRIVQDGLAATGRSFQDLGRYEKITLAQAAGFRSADEAARAFGNTQEDLAVKIGNTAVSQAEMEELAEQATDSMTQLKFAMMSFAVAIKPLTQAFAMMVDKFVEFGSGFPGGTAGLISAVTAAAGAVMMMTGAGAVPGGAMLAAGLSGMGLTALGGVDDGSLTFEAASGEMTRVPINSQDTAQVMLSKPGGPVARAAATAPAAAASVANTTLVVKVMLNERELGEAIVPMIDRRVLGTP